MDSITIPFVKINYINFIKERYDETVYNNMIIELKCSGDLRSHLSFYWKDSDPVPTELLEFISNSGINIDINSENDNGQ